MKNYLVISLHASFCNFLSNVIYFSRYLIFIKKCVYEERIIPSSLSDKRKVITPIRIDSILTFKFKTAYVDGSLKIRFVTPVVCNFQRFSKS